MLECVFTARRCWKRAAEWESRSATAVTAKERRRHLTVADHYRALAQSTERSMKAALEERFPRMMTA
jgi:hypothetical protein